MDSTYILKIICKAYLEQRTHDDDFIYLQFILQTSLL